MGNGFTVEGCDFGYNRSRGILIKASHGKIFNNHLEGCEMSSILVSPEYYWMESGSSSDVVITNNTITKCHGIPILVEATGGNGAIAPAGAHQDITISGNSITDCNMPGILVTSTSGLKIADNRLALREDESHFPDQMRKAGLTNLQAVVQIFCTP
jgi:parallel beta-helix repeat protein